MHLTRDELFLYLECLNEILRGFRIDNFAQTMGITKENLAVEDNVLREKFRLGNETLSITDIPIRSAVITATIKQLEDGVHEFQTRTGFELSEAEKFLRKIERSN